MKKILILITSLAISFGAIAQQASEGGFTSLHVKAQNPTEYTEFLRANAEQIFSSQGPSAAGVCITASGHNYPGEMFVWSAFPTMEAQFSGSENYDVYNVPKRLESLRDIVYSANWKPLKGFKLDPGYERVTRVVVSPENLPAYLAAGVALEAAIQDAGHDFNLGIMISLGGGPKEVGTLLVRGVSRDGAAVGKLADEYFSGAEWGRSLDAFVALQDAVVADSYEVCEQLYTAN